MKQNKSLATAILALALMTNVVRAGDMSNPPAPVPPPTQPTASSPAKEGSLMVELISQFSVILSRIAR